MATVKITKNLEKCIKVHFIEMKLSTHQEVTIVYVYALNDWSPCHLTHMLMDLKGDMAYNTLLMPNFSTTVSSMDRTTRQKSKKKPHN